MIRRARPEDRAALYGICLRTGDGGSDASTLYDDPELLGHVYLGPYLSLEPDLAFVVTAGDAGDHGDGAGEDHDRPQGYCVGTADTEGFERACAERWWPDLRRAYPLQRQGRSADRQLVDMIHHPPATDPDICARFPGHLHIDLLPTMQGRGAGAALIGRSVDALARTGCRGVHLGVAEGNARAIAFYRKVGFVDIVHRDGTLFMGRDLAGLSASGPDPGTGRTWLG